MGADVIVFNEAHMTHRYVLDALDRTLNDLMSTPEGTLDLNILVQAGYFQQCLPVVQ